jgi:hypothetical protein
MAARLPQGWPSLRQLMGTLATHDTYTEVVWPARDVVALDYPTDYRGHHAPLCLCFIGVTRCFLVLISTLADLADKLATIDTHCLARACVGRITRCVWWLAS